MILMTRMMIFKVTALANSAKIVGDVLSIVIGYVICSITARYVRLVWMSLLVMLVLMISLMAHIVSHASLLMITI